ncbi:hypothetical protein [Streptosporangium sandarakinum]|uniref:hypothetical protein n=1 Tax=Streptosporangium sandarakinum TaxID=1260955 RepID=UPI0037AAB707
MTRHRRRAVAATLCLAPAVACAGCAGGPAGTAPAPVRGPAAPPGNPAGTATGPAPDGPAPDGGAGGGGLPRGFARAGGPENGLTFGVPRSWVALDATGGGLERRLDRAGLTDKQIHRARAGLEPVAAHDGIWAFDPASMSRSPHRFATNLTARCRPGTASSAQLLADAVRRLAPLRGRILRAGTVPVAGGRAARVGYVFTVGGVRLHGLRLLLPAPGDRTCVLTLSTDDAARRGLLERIGGTLRPL